MKRKKILILLLPFLYHTAAATILPADKAVLNSIQVMFEFDEKPGADTYILTIIPGKEGVMKKTKYVNHSLACLVTEELQFDKTYHWYYEARKNGKAIFRSNSFEFSIRQSPLVRKDKFRFNIATSVTGAFQDNLVFIDYTGVAINRKGDVVWYLPVDNYAEMKTPLYRNLAMTNDGTVTYVQGEQCIEKNISGEILWKAPDDGAVAGDGREHYHHDFAKLEDGTYVACSYRFDTTKNYNYDTVVSRVRYNTVIRYDASGKVLWSWNEKEHVSKAEIFSKFKLADVDVAGTHQNGFDYDKTTNSFLFSFRDNSSILRVDAKTGETLNSLKGESNAFNGIVFHSQHSPVALKDGSLLIYNNNASIEEKTNGRIIFPSVLNVELPANGGAPKKIWEYECRMSDHPQGLVGKEGSAFELPNKNLLVCIGGANKIFEVSRNKKIAWEMNCEELNGKTEQWQGFTNYRAHYTSSMFPKYFTVMNLSGENTINLARPLELRISNDGTDADEYKLEVFSSNVLNNYSEVIKLSGQTGITKKIVLTKNKKGKTLQPGENFVVVNITPLSNPSKQKSLTYTIKQ